MMYPKKPARKKRKSHKASIMQEKDGTCYLCVLLQQDYRTHNYLEELLIISTAVRTGTNRRQRD